MTERQHWDVRYEGADCLHGFEPSEFLVENTNLLPGRGLALDVASGEGRNAIYLAECGYQVIALDISTRGLTKCVHVARNRNLPLDAAAVDLGEFPLPESWFDVIVNFNFLQRDLATRIAGALKPGGVVVFETLTTRHRTWKPDFNPAYLLEPGELPTLLAGLRLLKYREADIGDAERPRSVASLISRRDRV
ncbi:MAG TPA: class I SAM-dependent methyltransferase [Blastocatellia bacterium]|nr:class I SAM-dependent methyltransferase [Blastocatellia bacterium]